MPKTLFEYTGESASGDFASYFTSSEDMPRADADIVSYPETQIRLEKSIERPVAITRFSSRAAAELTWRRTARLIRADGGDFFLFRFVERGHVQAVTSHGTQVLEAGFFSISAGDLPYVSRSFPDAEGVHEAFQVWVPASLIGFRLAPKGRDGVYSALNGAGAVARALLHALFSEGERLDAATRAIVTQAWMATVISCVAESTPPQGRRASIREERGVEILRYVREHATEPGLSAERTARSCGISGRYLTMLLADQGLTFGEVLRDARMAAAETILVSTSQVQCSLGQVAALAGFRSASQFSRTFRRAHGTTPRAYRARHAATAAAGGVPFVPLTPAGPELGGVPEAPGSRPAGTQAGVRRGRFRPHAARFEA
jgi:AraC-like DNA-binding protein